MKRALDVLVKTRRVLFDVPLKAFDIAVFLPFIDTSFVNTTSPFFDIAALKSAPPNSVLSER